VIKIGYARVSSIDQNLDRQIAALRAEGCDKILRGKASGKSMRNRPELERAIDALPTKGILVLAEWDRVTRSLMDGIAIMERVHKRGAYIKVLDRPGLDLTTPSGRGIIALLSGLAIGRLSAELDEVRVG
jgi:DNA invertase Pin-like site-specific DNA recombinase